MEYKNTEHDPNSNDYEEIFEVKEPVDPNQYFLQEPEKKVKVEFEAYGLNEDNKNDLKSKRTIQINYENDSKTCIYSDKTIKPTDNLKVEVTSKSLLLKITKNLVSKIKVEKQSDKEEREENKELNRTHNTISEDNASYENHPLIEELRNDTEKKIYNCVHCGYSTVKRPGLVEHLLNHSDERQFGCAHCDYRTVRKTTLRKHIEAMHSSIMPNPHNDTANANRRKSFRCVSCNASYNRQYSLIRHIREHHNESGNTHNHNIPSCKICNFSSLNPSVLKNHALTHSLKSFKCEECQISYSRNDVLKRHLLNYHTAEILYQCKSCDRKFETEFGLLRHKELFKCAGIGKSKTSTPRFKCTICVKAFAYKSLLDLHRLTHTRQYPFKCSLCTEGFPTYTTLRYHIYSHSKESLYKCSVCNFATDHQTTMETHEANHTKRNTFNCPDCSYFTKKGNLFLRHREEHNYSKGTFQCAHCNYSTDIRDCIIRHLKIHSV